MLFVLLIAVNSAVEKPHCQERKAVLSNRIKVCVNQQLQRSSLSSFFQSARLRWLQPFSVIPFLTKYQHSYGVITISGAATVPSPVAHNRYL